MPLPSNIERIPIDEVIPRLAPVHVTPPSNHGVTVTVPSSKDDCAQKAFPKHTEEAE